VGHMPHGFGASHLARWPSFADYVQKCVSRAQQPPMCSPRMASAIKRSRYRAGQRPVYPVACAELELTGGVERLLVAVAIGDSVLARRCCGFRIIHLAEFA